MWVPASNTRLLTISGHVDHGKTTLADHLISSNGIISDRLAGTLRYLDFHPEEQRRGITIHASVIGLLFNKTNIVHLLDSPGHLDFSNQVSTCLRSCDVVLIVIDCLEGMGPRTLAVLRQAYQNKSCPILFINKIDKLHQLHLTPTEAYLRLRTLLETINAAVSAIVNTNDTTGNNNDTTTAATAATTQQRRQLEEQQWTFDHRNVIFGSALYGFGFTCLQIAKALYQTKLIPVKPIQGKAALWSDTKMKDGKLFKWKIGHQEPPLFAQFALEPLWNILDDPNNPQIIQQAFQYGAPTATTEKPKTVDFSKKMTTIKQFRPLSQSVLSLVMDYGPSPVARQWELTKPHAVLSPAIRKCQADSDVTCAHVFGWTSVEANQLPDYKKNDNDNDDDEPVLVGITRVLSGTLLPEKIYHCSSSNNSSSSSGSYNSSTTTTELKLYLFMGSSLVKVKDVPAGHLCGVVATNPNLPHQVTVSSVPNTHNKLVVPDWPQHPLVKVSVEATSAGDSSSGDALARGLVFLAKADASIQVSSTAKGERILACLGQVHLEQALLDLRRYCPDNSLRVSQPILDLGETTTWMENEEATVPTTQPWQMSVPPYNEEEGLRQAKGGRCRAILSKRVAAIHVRVLPLDAIIYKKLSDSQTKEQEEPPLDEGEWSKLAAALGIEDSRWESLRELVLATNANGNVLLQSPRFAIVGTDVDEIANLHNEDESTEEEALAAHERLLAHIRGDPQDAVVELDETATQTWKERMKGSVEAGFQLALRAGPVCEEPIRNVVVVLEGVEIATKSAAAISGGAVVAALRSGVRCALLSRPIRLMEKQLKLTLHSSVAGLGGLHSVLNKRRGRVVEDSMVEGADLLLITALVPQSQALEIGPEIAQNTSGQVTAPELVFSHWEIWDCDPFWVPTSEDELEDYGDDMTPENAALDCIRQVRQGKGLVLDSSRTVNNAEKQRTLKR